MLTHPDLVWIQTRQHQQELIAEAHRYRLLTAARRARRTRRDNSGPDDNGGARGRPASNVAPCPPRAAAPARP
jgi:hypothetical protein